MKILHNCRILTGLYLRILLSTLEKFKALHFGTRHTVQGARKTLDLVPCTLHHCFYSNFKYHWVGISYLYQPAYIK